MVIVIAALIGLIVAVLLSYGCYVIGYYRGRIDLLDELRSRFTMEGYAMVNSGEAKRLVERAVRT